MIEATVEDIRALLELADQDQGLDQRAAKKARGPAREATARRVPPPLLDRYQRLLEAGRLPVVVRVERGACSGCHVRLPTMFEYKARRSPAVHTCPHCHRLLYVPELVGAEAEGRSPRPAAASHARRS